MKIKLTIRNRSTDQSTEHEVEPSEPVANLVSKLNVFWGLTDNPADPFSLAAPSGMVLDPAETFIKTGLKNGDTLVLAPRSSLITARVEAPAPPVPEKVVLVLREYDGRRIRVHSGDAARVGVDDGDLIRLRDEISGTFAVGQAETDPEMQPGYVEIDQMTMNCLGANPEQEVVADRYPVETLKRLSRITFGIKPQRAEDDTLLVRVRQQEADLLKQTNRRVVIKGQMFRWTEMNVLVQVLETDPSLSGEEVGLISTDILKGFEYRLLTDEASFDGILLIDMSFSMEMDDLQVRGVQVALNYMADALRGAAAQRFIQTFREGQNTERYRGAILAALMYLAGKISRGKGERIGVILFSDAPSLIQFDGQNFFDVSAAGRDVSRIAETIVTSVDRMKKRSTKIAPALLGALEIVKVFGTKKPKMVVILTDGRPDDSEKAEQVVTGSIAPRRDMILFVAGIGEEVDEPLMQRWTAATGGEYIKVKDLNHLAEWYGSLARKLTVRASAESMEKGQQERF